MCGYLPYNLNDLSGLSVLLSPLLIHSLPSAFAISNRADSFSPAEIASRLSISKARLVITQDFLLRAGKQLPLYARLVQAKAPRAIVLPATRGGMVSEQLRQGDLTFSQLRDLAPMPDHDGAAASATSWWTPPSGLRPAGTLPHIAEASATTNILFSSGTTGEPKAIPWDHVSPLRCFANGWAHQDIRPGTAAVYHRAFVGDMK